jgi:hypothetical protein
MTSRLVYWVSKLVIADFSRRLDFYLSWLEKGPYTSRSMVLRLWTWSKRSIYLFRWHKTAAGHSPRQVIYVLRRYDEDGPICWWLGCGYYIRSCAPLGHIQLRTTTTINPFLFYQSPKPPPSTFYVQPTRQLSSSLSRKMETTQAVRLS